MNTRTRKRFLTPTLNRSSPRTVIRGESIGENNKIRDLTDWLNVTFPFLPAQSNIHTFFNRFSEVTGFVYGDFISEGRGLHGWEHSYISEKCTLKFAFGGQNDTAFLSFSGEACASIPNWHALMIFLRDEVRGRITRWDGAVDDFKGKHSVDDAVKIYQRGVFKNRGREPKPYYHGNWCTPDTEGRTFEVGKRKNGKFIRIYEKGKQLGDPNSPWVRWEVEHRKKDRFIPFDVLINPAQYIAGAYPCLTWVSGNASHIPTIKAQHKITYEHLTNVLSIAYGRHLNLMMQEEGSAKEVIQKLRRKGIPRRLQFSNSYLNNKSLKE